MSAPSLPLLTIAIPTVSRLSLMKLALASALAQTIPVDIILSDNGSTDGTKEYLAALSHGANLRLFRHEATMPVQDHGTFLTSQVRTEWVVYLSDDDQIAPNFAGAVEAIIRERPAVDLVYTGCDMTFGDVAVRAKVGPRFESAGSFFYEFMLGNRNICMCATAFRLVDRQAIGPQPRNILIGDMYYWTRILSGGGIVGCAQEPLCRYSFYRPGMPTQTNGVSVADWLRESQAYASLMAQSIRDDPSAGIEPAAIDYAEAKFLALTTSNQFAWNALRGAKKWHLICALIQLWRPLIGYLSAPPRAIAAIILPRWLLERRLLSHARRLAAAAASAP